MFFKLYRLIAVNCYGIVFGDDKAPSTLRACAKFGCFRCSDASQASESCFLVIKIRAFSIRTMFINVNCYYKSEPFHDRF